MSRRFGKNTGHANASSTSPARDFRTQRTENYASQNESNSSDAITSKDNRWLKLFRAGLQGTGPAAGEAIAVEGPKLIEDALRAGLAAEALLVSESGERLLPGILDAARNSDDGIAQSRVLRTSDLLFASVAGTESPQGVAALFRQPNWHFDNLLGAAGNVKSAVDRGGKQVALVVVIVGVQDPGNVGTILRSAEAFGATGVIAARGTSDPWSPKAVRASAGSALRVALQRGATVSSLPKQLRAAGLKIIASSSHSEAANAANDGIDLTAPTALFIGSEGAGLPQEIIEAADATMAIPITSTIESLNAGVAASILLYEAARQRAAILRTSRD